MRSINVLVTGAGGFLGRYVVALRDAGHRVCALVRPVTDITPLNWPADIEVFRADLSEADNLAAAFDGIDVLVHLAAQVRGDDQTRVSATHIGTERLLNAMAVSATRRLILTSSFSFYDYHKLHGTLDETSPIKSADLHQCDSNAIAKIDREQMVRRLAQQYAWELNVLRPGFIWGPGHLDLSSLVQRLGPLYLIIGPRATLPLSYVENCAEAFAKAATAPAGLTLNVLNDESVTTWRYAGEYIRSTGQAAIRVPVPYSFGLLASHLIGAMQRIIFLGALSLPDILRLHSFKVRFKPPRLLQRRPSPNPEVASTIHLWSGLGSRRETILLAPC